MSLEESNLQTDQFNLQTDQLLTLMGYVLSGDNAKIQEATKVLKVYTKKIQSVGTLASILAENPNQPLRQLAAILLKRHVITLYSQLEPHYQTELKRVLLNRFFSEEANVIRTNIGQIIGVIAQQVLADNQWPELYTILQQQTQKGQDVVFRQRGLVLLSLVFDYSGDALKQFYSSFFPFFVENLSDTDKQIRTQTVKCLISLFDNIQYMEKKEAQQYKTLVEPILGFVDQSLREGDEDNAYHCFDAFSYLAEAKLTILDNHLGMIIQYAAGPNILLNPKCSHKFKECVIDFIYTVTESHRKVLQKNQPLLKQLIEALCLLVAQPMKTQEYEEDEEPIQDIALWLVEVICVSMPKKKVLYGIFLETVTQLVGSNDLHQMNAGYLILAAITEGLQDHIRRNLQNPIMSVLIPKGLEDPRVEVRGATIKALTYFSEFLCPEILSYDHIVIPQMVRNLGEVDTRVREKGLVAIDIFAENMEEEAISKYLPTLVPTLAQLFIHNSSNMKSRRLCLSSLGAIITSSRVNFTPYLGEVSQLLLQVLGERDSPEIMGIKAEAITCLGKIAEAFPTNQQVQQQLISSLSSQVYQLLISHQDYEIREACLSFFYNQAAAQKEQFAPVFEQIIEFTIQLAQSSEGVTYDKKPKQEFSLDTESDEDEGGTYEPNDKNCKVKVTQLDEKAAAIHALGQFAVAVPIQFGPYFKRVSEILEETINYFYENVRIQSVHCYRDFIEGLVRFSNAGQVPQWTPGLPCIQRPLNAEAESFVQKDLMVKLLQVLVDDESSDAVVVALDAIEQLMKNIGPSVIDANITILTKNLKALLDKKTRCFGDEGDESNEDLEEEENEEEEEEDEDTNETIFEAITDLIPQMAKTLKLGFMVPYNSLLPSLLQYCNYEREQNDILQTIGCFAEIFTGEPATINVTANTLLPLLIKAPTYGDVELNRNSAYCMATFIEFGQVDIVQQYLPQVLGSLMQIYEQSASYQAAVDNAAAALCKVIMRFPESVPVAQALSSVLKLLPFKGDEEEEFTAIRMLLHLGNTLPDLISSNIETVIKILLDGVLQKDKYKIKNDKLILVTNAIKSLALNPTYKQIIEQNVFTIADESQKAQLIAALQ